MSDWRLVDGRLLWHTADLAVAIDALGGPPAAADGLNLAEPVSGHLEEIRQPARRLDRQRTGLTVARQREQRHYADPAGRPARGRLRRPAHRHEHAGRPQRPPGRAGAEHPALPGPGGVLPGRCPERSRDGADCGGAGCGLYPGRGKPAQPGPWTRRGQVARPAAPMEAPLRAVLDWAGGPDGPRFSRVYRKGPTSARTSPERPTQASWACSCRRVNTVWSRRQPAPSGRTRSGLAGGRGRLRAPAASGHPRRCLRFLAPPAVWSACDRADTLSSA